MKALTNRQREVLDFINAYRLEHQMPPTRREIALNFGFKSANAAEEHLHALVAKGALLLRGGQSRGIFVTGFAP